MTQTALCFDASESAELGEFCYIRPRKGEADYEDWLSYVYLYVRAAIGNGRERTLELRAEAYAYADELDSAMFAMKGGRVDGRASGRGSHEGRICAAG